MEAKIIVCTQVHDTSPGIRYIAKLSDGTEVFQDEIPELEQSWFRLGKYIKQKKLSIVDLKLCRAEKSITIPGQNHRGYCVGNRLRFLWPDCVTTNTKFIGWLDQQDVCHVINVALPKFKKTWITTRTVEEMGVFLIRND